MRTKENRKSKLIWNHEEIPGTFLPNPFRLAIERSREGKFSEITSLALLWMQAALAQSGGVASSHNTRRKSEGLQWPGVGKNAASKKRVFFFFCLFVFLVFHVTF
jgi:hypothetical protein